jgi:hypothetical protein
MIHLIDCKPLQGRPAQSTPTRGTQRYLSAREYLFGATQALARGFAVLYAGPMLP